MTFSQFRLSLLRYFFSDCVWCEGVEVRGEGVRVRVRVRRERPQPGELNSDLRDEWAEIARLGLGDCTSCMANLFDNHLLEVNICTITTACSSLC